jgi:SNF2 family DNA or RNA helicase
MSNWRREAEHFTPDLKVLTLQGAERKQWFDKINDYDLVLTTYPLLTRDDETLLKHEYHYLILDEAQTIKNPTSLAAQLVRRIKTNHRLCLTGTPMENHLGELWAQFDFLMPGFLGDNASFRKRYRTPIEVYGDREKNRACHVVLRPLCCAAPNRKSLMNYRLKPKLFVRYCFKQNRRLCTKTSV